MKQSRNRNPLLASLILGLASIACADLPLDGTQAVAIVGGVPAVDMVRVTAGDPGVPLRFGNVLPKSERVTLGGRVLLSGTDYAMDYASGVVYLYRSAKSGESVTVEYRYDKSKPAVSGSNFAGLPALRFGLLPNAGLSLNLGMGVTERAADGTVLRSNLFGTSNDLKLGGASLTGVYMMGQRQQVGVEGGMAFDAGKGGDAEAVTGDSKFLVQAFRMGLAGGTVTIDQQEISENFVGFSSLRGGSLDDARLSQLQKERGLIRSGFGLTGMKALGGALSYRERNVRDEQSAIDWREYGYQSGGLKFSAYNRKVDSSFSRSKDLAEADREQIGKEAGLTRGGYSGEFRTKAGALSMTGTSITESGTERSVNRREVKLDTSRFGFDFGDQSIDAGFARFDSLLGEEKALWGTEAGLRRQWLGVRTSALFGTEIKARRSGLVGEKGRFATESASIKARSWSFEHSATSATPEFDRIGAMSGTELGARANEIATMYSDRPFAAARGVDGGDLEALKRSAGLTRTFDRVQLTPRKGTSVEATNLRLDGSKDRAGIQTLAVSGRDGAFAFRRLNVGADFGEIASLMNLERARLGEVKGLARSDARLDLKLGTRSNLTVEKTDAVTKDGAMERTRVAYNDPKLQFRYNTREVDTGFAAAGGLVDDERDALASLAGFQQREILLNWQAFRNVKLEYADMSAKNAVDGREREDARLAFAWALDPSTRIAYARQSNGERDPLKTIFHQEMERVSVMKSFGAGAFEYISDKRDYEGVDAKAPDSRLEAVALEARVDKKTTLRTERARTEYSDGNSESVATNSVRTEINKRVGVSVSDTKISRTGDAKDETKRDYGVWVDFGGGIRLSYGYVRNLLGEDAGLASTSLTFGKDAARTDAQNVNTVQAGNVNGTEVAFGSGGNTWDDQGGRVQSFNNLRLKTTKPFQFLWMKACGLAVNVDTASDKSVWVRENQQLAFEGKMGGTALGFEYRGQADPQGARAIDRTLRVKTDPSDKAPISAALMYKQRTLPTDEVLDIRDLSLTIRPAKGMEITNQMQTNPETFRGDVLLGSTPRADRSNKWKVDFKGKDTSFGGSWEELRNEATNIGSTTAGLNMTMFGSSGSPLSLFYGLEQRDALNVRSTINRYSVTFDQRPGPNQMFSLFVGNLSYIDTTPDDVEANNWSVRVNYQLKF